MAFSLFPLQQQAEPDNADLWGLNPTTGRLYTVRDRRAMLHDRGVRGTPGGPAPSAMWDDYTDRVYNAMHGIPEGFQAPVQGNQLAPSAQALNRQLIKRARNAEAEFEGGPIEAGLGAGMSQSSRPSLEAVKAYRGYEGSSGEKRRREGVIRNQDQRAAQFYPKAGK